MGSFLSSSAEPKELHGLEHSAGDPLAPLRMIGGVLWIMVKNLKLLPASSIPLIGKANSEIGGNHGTIY